MLYSVYQNQVHVNIIIFFNVFQTVLHDEQAGLRMEAIETEVVGPSQPLGDTSP